MNAFTSTGTLVQHALRRDRVVAPVWIGLLVLTIIGVATQYAQLLPTDVERIDFVAQIGGNAALSAFTGQLYGHGLGNLTMWKIGDISFMLIALMAVLNVIRHTRAEEESGRAELVAAGAVGRLAPLTAGLLETAGISFVIGVVTAAGLTLIGLPIGGAFVFGAGLTSLGCLFAAVAGVAAQLTERARAATGLAAVVLGLAYLIRFVAAGSGVLWLRWFSATGWSHLMEPFAGNRWWVAAIPAIACALAVTIASRLASRRDLGAGMLTAGTGPAEAAPTLRGPVALAWRLHRGQLLAWTLAITAFAAAAGAVATSVPNILDRSGEQIQELLRRYAAAPDAGLTDTFIWMILISIGGITALYPLLVTLRLRDEETNGRAELTLSTGVNRTRWALSHLLFAALGPAIMLTAAGFATGLVYGLATSDLVTQLPRVLTAALVLIPPAWTIGSIAMLAVGLLPRFAAGLAWAAFLLTTLFGETLGPVLGIDYWIANQLNPFHHVPKVITGAEFALTPMLVLTVVALAITTAGLAALQRRDLT